MTIHFCGSITNDLPVSKPNFARCAPNFLSVISAAGCKLTLRWALFRMEKFKLDNRVLWLIAPLAFVLLVGAVHSIERKGRTHTIPNVQSRMSALPPIILCAWEKPEKLDSIDPPKVG